MYVLRMRVIVQQHIEPADQSNLDLEVMYRVFLMQMKSSKILAKQTNGKAKEHDGYDK